jgi:hypothetical protein
MVKLYNANDMDSIEWSTKQDGEFIRRFFEPLIKKGTQATIKNIETSIYLLEIDDLILPITINQKEFNNSFVASPYTHYISYAKEELWELGNWRQEKFFTHILNIIGFILRKSNINKVVVVNNFLMSTNLYPHISNDQVKRLTAYLTSCFPQHTLLFRSINETLHHDMITGLKRIGYKGIMSRSIYLFDPKKILTRKQRKVLNQDQKLIQKFGYQIRDIKDDEYSIIEVLYSQLYIVKYSKNNPQFTKDFFKNIVTNKLLHFKLVCKDSEILGVIGCWVKNGVLTTPILGYLVNRDKEYGLYRVLSYLITKEILAHHYLGHRSAGASKFKQKRGSIQEIEYTYFYQEHLPFKSKLAWSFFKWIMDFFVEPLAKKMKF